MKLTQDLKRNIILENYQEPLNFEEHQELDKVLAHNPTCIDNLTLYVDFKNNKIEAIYFSGEGCAISISSTSLMIKNLKGKTKEEAINIIENYLKMVKEEKYDSSLLEELLVFDTISKQPNRINCATLSFENLLNYLKERK